MRAGGLSVGPQAQAGGPLASGGGSADLARSLEQIEQLPALARRHRRFVAVALLLAGAVALLAPTVLIAAIHLPWLLLLVPGLVGLVLLGVGVVLLRSGPVTTAGVSAGDEQRLLDLAAAAGGRLTVTAAARELGLTLLEAEKLLSAMARTGHVVVENDSASGVVVYAFPEIEAGLGGSGQGRATRRLT